MKEIHILSVIWGIGRDIAIQLVKCGAQVLAVGRSKDLLSEYLL